MKDYDLNQTQNVATRSSFQVLLPVLLFSFMNAKTQHSLSSIQKFIIKILWVKSGSFVVQRYICHQLISRILFALNK